MLWLDQSMQSDHSSTLHVQQTMLRMSVAICTSMRQKEVIMMKVKDRNHFTIGDELVSLEMKVRRSCMAG